MRAPRVRRSGAPPSRCERSASLRVEASTEARLRSLSAKKGSLARALGAAIAASTSISRSRTPIPSCFASRERRACAASSRRREVETQVSAAKSVIGSSALVITTRKTRRAIRLSRKRPRMKPGSRTA